MTNRHTFKVTKYILFERYFSWIKPLLVFLVIICLGGILLGRFDVLYSDFILPIFVSGHYEIITLLLLLGILMNISNYKHTQSLPKKIIIGDYFLKIIYYNYNTDKIELGKITKLKWGDEQRQSFELCLKDGDIKSIPATIQKKDEAFKLIRERIATSKQGLEKLHNQAFI